MSPPGDSFPPPRFPLQYARASKRNRLAYLTNLANLALLYPFVLAALFYLEWLLAWCELGHRPLPSINDPVNISLSGPLHLINGLLILLAVPVAFLSLFANVIHSAARLHSARQTFIRLFTVVASWIALFLLFRADPGQVLFWWFD